MNDLRFAFRQLLKNPGFTAIAVLTLALGIGANTAMFSFLNSLLLRPLPFPESSQLVKLYRVTPQNQNDGFSPADYLDLKHDEAGFGRFAGYQPSSMTLDDSDRPSPWFRVSTGLFDILGVRPELGRSFRPEEEIKGNDRVVLISHGLWLERFGGAADVLGKTVHSDGQGYEIIGVLSSAATDHRLFNQVELFSPLSFGDDARSARNTHGISVLGRRDRKISAGQGNAFIESFGARMAADFPTENAGSNWRSEGLPESTMSPTGKAILLLLLGLSGFVLLIACSNLANFLLARTIERARDLAVRAALGASRRHLLRPLALESLVLAILGGGGALFVSVWTTDWLRSTILNNGGPTFDFPMDWRVLSFALIMSVITILFFGVAPAMLTLRINANDALKSGARGGTPGRGHQKIGHLLIIGQFTLTMTLLAGAGFFVRGSANMLKQDYGWNSDHVVKADFVLPTDKYPDGAKITAFHRRLMESLEQLPGVKSASLCTRLPYLGLRASSPYLVEGREPLPRGQEPWVLFNDITPSYFEVTETRLLGGRKFNESDNATSPKVVLINETMARAFFPDENSVGRRVARAGSDSPDWAEIVGVVADTRSIDVADKPGKFQLYEPMAQNPGRAVVLAMRTDGRAPESAIKSMRTAIDSLDSELPLREMMTANRMIQQMTSQMSMVRQLLTVFALLGLFLATLGIYGMISRTVVQRTGEIGIRMAVGAQVSDVIRLILGSGARVALIGVVLGLLGAFGLSRLLAAVLPSMQVNGGLVLASATALLAVIALAACWLPARRAARVDPMIALRNE